MIYHIATQKAWEQAQTESVYTVDTLAKDGFIHFSDLHQVVRVANHLFRNQQDLVLLVTHKSLLTSILKYEDLYDSDENFPHLYGPLNLEAVLSVLDFKPNSDGYFTLPDGILTWIQ